MDSKQRVSVIVQINNIVMYTEFYIPQTDLLCDSAYYY